VRLALIGTGPWAKNIYRTVETEVGDAVISRVSNLSGNVPEWCVSSRFDPRGWEHAIDRRYVDGVIVATPPNSHAAIVRHAVKERLPVFVEKPLCLSLAEAHELHTYVGRSEVPILVDHVHLFAPAFRELVRLLDGRRPKLITSFGGGWGPFRKDYNALWDWGPHDVAMILALMGEYPAQVESSKREKHRIPGPALNAVEEFALSLQFQHGTRSETVVSNGWTTKRRTLEVNLGGGAAYHYDALGPVKLSAWHHEKQGDLEEYIAVDPTPPLTAALREFTNAIRYGRGPTPPFGLRLAIDVVSVLASAQLRL
jgi:predicted dehydrogenase